MRVVYGPGCDKAWRDALTDWQRHYLAAYHRQDPFDGGTGARFRQRGVRRRRFQSGRELQPAGPTVNSQGHERIVILRRPWGFDSVGIRRVHGIEIDPDTGEIEEREVVWVPCWRWHVAPDYTSNQTPQPDADGKYNYNNRGGR